MIYQLYRGVYHNRIIAKYADAAALDHSSKDQNGHPKVFVGTHSFFINELSDESYMGILKAAKLRHKAVLCMEKLCEIVGEDYVPAEAAEFLDNHHELMGFLEHASKFNRSQGEAELILSERQRDRILKLVLPCQLEFKIITEAA